MEKHILMYSGDHHISKATLTLLTDKLYILYFLIAALLFSLPTIAQEESNMDSLLSMSLRDLLSVNVSAQKREELLQNVPISMRVITNSHIDKSNITRVEELSNLATSLIFDKRIGFTKSSFKIRGIGTQVFGAGVEPSVATFVDGVVMARGGAGFTDLDDIERIEILYGSQSTLFGKNSSAGLVHIITASPNEENHEYRIKGLVTDDHEAQVKVMATGPLSDSLAYRFNALARNYNGNVNNTFTGNDLNGYETQGAKLKLLGHSSEAMSWLLTVDYSEQNTSHGVRILRVDSTSIFTDPQAVGLTGVSGTAGNITGIAGSKTNDKVSLDRDPFIDTEAWGISLEANLDLADYTLTNITAYRGWQQKSDRDNDQTQLPFSLIQLESRDVKWFSNELRLTSPLYGNYDYVAGLYYYSSENFDRSGDDRTFSNSPYLLEFNLAENTIKNDNVAIFGQLNWHLSDQLSSFLGARYIYDKIDGHLSRIAQTRNNPFLDDGAVTSNRDVTGVSNNHSVTAYTGNTGMTFDFTPKIMTYASYSHGFKGEAFNTSFKFDEEMFKAGPVNPETSNNYEIGIRSRWFDEKLKVDLTSFYTDYSNLQLTVRDLVNNQNVLASVPKVTSKGIEVDFIALFSDHIIIEGAASYTDASYKNFTNANCYSRQTTAQGCIANFSGRAQDLSGQTLANTPKLKATIGLNYNFNGIQGGTYFNANWRIQSGVNLDPALNPDAKQNGYGVLDIGIGSAWNNNVSIKLFMNNVFDKQYVSGVTINGNAGGDLILHLIPRDFRRIVGFTATISI